MQYFSTLALTLGFGAAITNAAAIANPAPSAAPSVQVLQHRQTDFQIEEIVNLFHEYPAARDPVMGGLETISFQLGIKSNGQVGRDLESVQPKNALSPRVMGPIASAACWECMKACVVTAIADAGFVNPGNVPDAAAVAVGMVSLVPCGIACRTMGMCSTTEDSGAAIAQLKYGAGPRK